MNSIIYNKDCISGLQKLKENSVDGCITDPPYNYEFVGKDWDKKEIDRRLKRIESSKTLVKNIPYGSGLSGGVRNTNWYKKNRNNILEYSDWCSKWGAEVFRVLKPGAFVLVFNSTRTVAHVQVALESVGFYARDILVWRRNSGIPKGLNIEKKAPELADRWKGWHSCLRNEWEAIAVLQKPLVNNYIQTVEEYGVGLFRAKPKDKFVSNIIEGMKRTDLDKVDFHCTVKPYKLIRKLIKLTIPCEKNRVVLDPFMGSGTTAIAALSCGIKYIGFEINKEYCTMAKERIRQYEK